MADRLSNGADKDRNIRAFILGAQRGQRHLDNALSVPPALKNVSERETVLDWLIHALRRCGVVNITYVGGYHIEKVIARFPDLGYRYVADWASATESELARPLLEPENGSDILLIRADLVVLPDGLRRLLDSSANIAMATLGASQIVCGLTRVRSGAIADFARALPIDAAQIGSIAGNSDLRVDKVDLTDYLAAFDDQMAVRKLIFNGKGRTLEQIKPILQSATVLDLIRIPVDAWRDQPESCINNIRSRLSAKRLIVRSSAESEDAWNESQAGRFLSVGAVPRDDRAALGDAIERVISSFHRDGRELGRLDEVVVQPFVFDVVSAGVILTRDTGSGAPYFVINIESASGRTDAVTAGNRDGIETYYVAWNCDDTQLPKLIAKPVKLARELMLITSVDLLDIEFASTVSGEIFLLQVRPLFIPKHMPLIDGDLLDTVAASSAFLRGAGESGRCLLGGPPLFGTMTDWNPAEMIGRAPSALALSLYQNLIGESAWSEARAKIGYRDVGRVPLIISIGGIPFVDVRASLNSLLPAEVDDASAAAWVSDCLRRMREQPELHDKAEFEITLTCLDVDVDRARRLMSDAGLGAQAIADFVNALRAMTNRFVCEEVLTIDQLLASSEKLGEARKDAAERGSGAPAADFAAARNLLETCRSSGIVPFAILARYAFVALALLRSLRQTGVLSDEEFESFMGGIPTVAGDLTRDFAAYSAGSLDRSTVLERYGHLRPNSYQITSLRYDSAPDIFLAEQPIDAPCSAARSRRPPHGFSDTTAQKLDRVLKAAGLNFDHRRLSAFATAAIGGRERAKFEFTKNLSMALEKIAAGGEKMGLDRETLAHLPIENLLRLATNIDGNAIASNLRRQAGFNEKKWLITKSIRLPDLIGDERDPIFFRCQAGQPNFVTRHRITAPVIVINGATSESLDGKIVLLESADPGFDWIFSHRLAGLITQLGGIGSHMAIRAMEFDLPAAVGCGADLFLRLSRASKVDLDCANRTIRPVS